MIGIISVILIVMASVLYRDNVVQKNIDYTKIPTILIDNVTRTAILQIDEKHNDTRQALSAHVIMTLDVIGKQDTINIYPIAPRNHNIMKNLVIEDENRIPLKDDCCGQTGIFQQMLIVPLCIDDPRIISGVADTSVFVTNHSYKRIFAEYDLSDILPENGRYNINFTSLYPVKINLPEESIVLSNHTGACIFPTTDHGNDDKNEPFGIAVTFELR